MNRTKRALGLPTCRADSIGDAPQSIGGIADSVLYFANRFKGDGSDHWYVCGCPGCSIDFGTAPDDWRVYTNLKAFDRKHPVVVGIEARAHVAVWG
jgi:hypothetical protein